MLKSNPTKRSSLVTIVRLRSTLQRSESLWAKAAEGAVVATAVVGETGTTTVVAAVATGETGTTIDVAVATIEGMTVGTTGATADDVTTTTEGMTGATADVTTMTEGTIEGTTDGTNRANEMCIYTRGWSYCSNFGVEGGRGGEGVKEKQKRLLD